MYKRFWLEGMAPWGLAQEKRSVCINTAGQNIIRTISLLALLPGLSHCLEEAKALWSVPRALPALEQVIALQIALQLQRSEGLGRALV